jgi:hypothetical protein
MSDREFVSAVFQAEVGKDILSVNRQEFDQVKGALGAGRYDWDTAEQTPNGE